MPKIPNKTTSSKLTPMQKMIMKEFGVSAPAAVKAAAKFKKLETKTQKTGKNKIYSMDQGGINYGKATKNLLKNQ
jgi:hypothetical protein